MVSWGMFFFGFLAMFIITQMHGLGLSKWLRWAFYRFIFGLRLELSYGSRGWETMEEIPRVPAVEYLLVFGLWGSWFGSVFGCWPVLPERIAPKLKNSRF